MVSSRYVPMVVMVKHPMMDPWPAHGEALPFLQCDGPDFDPLWRELRVISAAHRQARVGW